MRSKLRRIERRFNEAKASEYMGCGRFTEKDLLSDV